MAIQDFVPAQILTANQMDALQANDYNWTVSNKTASYTLVAADKGTRVVMSNAGATTITVNTGLFSAGDTLFIQNIGVGTCTITAGTATVTTASSLALGTWAGGTLYFTSASAAIFFSGGGAVYGAATGGSSSSITVGGINYTLLTFTSSGTLTVTKSGLFDCLIFAGGAGSQSAAGFYGPGGGGGGFLQQTVYLTANATVTIGAGGAGTATSTSHGVGYGAITSIGSQPVNISVLGGTGEFRNADGKGLLISGSGSGGISATGSQLGVNTIQGNRGGDAVNNTAGGGGGGAGGVGGNGAGTTGGSGGAGYDVSAFISGSALGKGAGGGAGGSVTGGAAGLGGVAGTTGTANAAAANSAGGGGGGNASNANGGSGIVYVRFRV